MRYISLPNIPVSKIKKIIKFEAEQQIPFMLNEVEWAYELLPSHAKHDIDIVIAAAKKAFVNKLVEVLVEYGFVVESIEAGQLVLFNLVLASQEVPGGTIVLDIGARSTEVLLLYKGMCWGRSLRRGMFQITKNIATAANLSLEEAEQQKKHFCEAVSLEEDILPLHKEGFPLAETIQEKAVNGFLDIAQDVSRTISYYGSMIRGAAFDRVFITGGGAYVKGAAEFLSKQLEIPVQYADFTGVLDFSDHVQERFWMKRHSYHLTGGLIVSESLQKKALNANLVSAAIRQKRRASEEKKQKYLLFVIVLFILITMLLNTRYELHIKKTLTEDLQTAVFAAKEKEAQLKPILRKINRITQKLDLIDNVVNERNFISELLKEVFTEIPGTMWLEAVKFDAVGKILILSGKTPESLATINEFTEKLKTLKTVNDVSFEAANILEESKENELPVRSFILHIIVKNCFQEKKGN